MFRRRRAAAVTVAAALAVLAAGVAAPAVSGARGGVSTAATTAPTTVPPGTIPILWRDAPAGNGTVNQPALWQNRVIITVGAAATAVRLPLGSAIWSTTVPDPNHLGLSLGAPTLANGKIDAAEYFAVGAGTITFDPANGSYTEVPPSLHTYRGLLVVDGQQQAEVNAFFAGTTGAYTLQFVTSWWVATGPAAVGTPLISGGRAWLTVGSSVEMFDPAGPCLPLPIPNPPPYCLPSATFATDFNPKRPSYGGPGRIAVASTGASNSVKVFTATGQTVWTYTDASTVFGPTAWAGNRIFVGGADGMLRVLDATTGALVWKGNAGAPITVAPTITNGKVYVATNGARLVTFAAGGCGASTCSPIATGDAHKPGAVAAGPPLIRNGVAVTAFANEVIAFSAG